MPVVPQSATMENQEGMYLYILDKDNLPQMVYIKTMGQTDDNMWIVSEGVKPGDRILTGGMQKVIQGKPVRVVQTLAETPQKVKKPNIFVRIFNKLRKK